MPRSARSMAGMRFDSLLQPLNIAGLVTIAAVAATLVGLPAAHWPLAFGLLLLFALLMLLDELLPQLPPWTRHASLVAMGVITLVLLWRHPRAGALPILTVVLAAVMAGTWPLRRTAVAMLAGNAVAWWMLHRAGFDNALISVILIACFQLFAALTMHYARSAEATRDALALVNADLLATRALLADATRDAERLRMARELHDVAGHNLTALRLNLRALADDPALAARSELQTAQAAAAQLMGDIRGVVQALRDARGLDIATALQALAAPLPRPRLALEIEDDVRIDNAATAETMLRTVQEALTNAARHGQAQTLRVRLQARGDTLHLTIDDDACDAARDGSPLREGNGLTGMRERIAALGGRIDIARRGGGVRIDAELPA